jgi:hypothetical protein
MVSIAITGLSTFLSAGVGVTAGAAAAINIAATIAATAAYAYIDQPYIIPFLFGSDSPKDQNRIGNLQLPTTNAGEPRYRAYGREAYVPGHFLWVKNQKVLTVQSGGGSGKGATAQRSVSERFADIGVAACDGPIMGITSAMSNRSVFYGERSSSASVFADSRVSLYQAVNTQYYGTPSDSALWDAATISAWGYAPKNQGLIAYINPTFGVTELLGDHFDAGDVVEMHNVGEGDGQFQSNSGGFGIRRGVYTVIWVGRDAGSSQDYIVMIPLAGQPVDGLGLGGVLRDPSEPEPVIIRRIDECVCGYTPDFNNPHPTLDVNDVRFVRFQYTQTSLQDDPTEFEFLNYSLSGVNESLLTVEVHGSHGGWDQSSGAVRPIEAELPSLTKLNGQRLKVGNTYELQGFCDLAGNASSRTISGALSSIQYKNFGHLDTNLQPPSNNTGYSAGVKYVLGLVVSTSDLQDIIDELGTGGDPNGYTKLYPGNGQFKPMIPMVVGGVPNFNGNDPSYVDLSTSGSPITDLSVNRVSIGDPGNISRTGGAQPAVGGNPAKKGGCGDVGFCILPPRQGKFSYHTTLTGVNIGQQNAEFNSGQADQEALSNSGGIAHRGIAHVSFTDLNLYQFGNAIPQVSFKVRESDNRSVGDIVSKMVDDVAPTGSVIPGFSSSLPAYGYSIAGGTPVKQAIQPLAVAFGFSLQERAGKMAMLQDSELPVVNVPLTKLNAHDYSGSSNLMQGLRITQIDSDDLPQRVVVKYLSISTGNEEARSAGIRSPGSEDAGRRDTIEYNLRPLVITDGYAKTRAQQLLDKSRTESATSSTVLPPSRMDVLPGHVIATSSNSDAYAAPDTSNTTSIGLTDRKGQVIAGSVSVHFRFITVSGSFAGGDYSESIQSCTLVDDGNGSMIGEPDNLTITSTVGYTASGQWLTIAVTTANTTIIDPARVAIRYQYVVSRTFRATKATLSGVDFTVSAPLVTTAHNHTFPSHQHRITRELPPVGSPTILAPTILPIDDPSISGPWGDSPEIGLAILAPTSSGATIYESSDGVGNWTEIGQIFGSATVMEITNVVEADGSAGTDLPHYTTLDTIESMVDYGRSLVLFGTELDVSLNATITIRQVLEGHNNFYCNGEVFGAQWIATSGGTTVLGGLVRCLRGTRYASMNNGVGSQVVYLPRGPGGGIAHIVPVVGYAGHADSRFLRAVVPGSTLALTPTVTIATRGIRSLPGAPIVDENSVKVLSDGSVTVTWDRPPTQPAPIFGMDPLPAGYFERYEVYAFTPGDITELEGIAQDNEIISKAKAVWYVGSQTSGSPILLDRTITYTAPQQTSDAFATSVLLSFAIFAVGPAGRGPNAFADFEEISVTVTA